MPLIDRIESLFGALGEKVENFSGDRLRVVIGCALAAGLSIPLAWFGLRRVSILWKINTPSWKYILTFALVCVTCYMAAALLLVGAKIHRRGAFDWVAVVILGSFILASFSDILSNPEIMRRSVYDLVFVHVRDALERTVWISMFTLPIAALVNYSGSIVRAVARWHSGRGCSLGISAK